MPSSAFSVTLKGDKALNAKLRTLGNAGNIKGRIWSDSSVAPYGPYVQKHGRQAWMHRSWWADHTDKVVAERTVPWAVNDLRKAIDYILAGKGAKTGNPLRQWMGRWTLRVWKGMQKYPPERPGPYVRTFRLRNSWNRKTIT